uniref:Movement protein TGBp3 n=2 Tax=Phlox virus M TaxID=437470 RepID=A4ZYY1_9VIRU|nr:triple gene block 3 protein [Phlox virus M]
MLIYAVVLLCAFSAVLFALRSTTSDCIVIVTGESVRIQGCALNSDFQAALSGLKPLGACSLG